ncbi:MAG: NAD(+)/NADH kinase [Lachnospiraceae bacterium]|nr:NAD(+)/NADH kinase [Lachnospiraceae bacterium]
MNRFFLIANKDKDKDFIMTGKIKALIENMGGECYIRKSDVPESVSSKYSYTNPDEIPENIDCIIVLGGDGTLILAARDLVRLDIPFIGVNFGNLGYLAEVEKQDIEETIYKLIEGKYNIESRIMLSGTVYRDGKELESNVALNDIVVGRSGSLRVIDFNIYVDGIFLNQYTADGIIIATPTGSTAYNLSAGGPIVEPSANIVVLTPVCAHTLNTRSVVLSAESGIEIEICDDRHNTADCCDDEKIVSFDGNSNIKLIPGDRIKISKSELDTKIVKLSNKSFVEILQKKMSIK